MGWLDAWLLCGLAAVAAGFDVALPLPRFTPRRGSYRPPAYQPERGRFGRPGRPGLLASWPYTAANSHRVEPANLLLALGSNPATRHGSHARAGPAVPSVLGT
jgi:hypothetical protein